MPGSGDKIGLGLTASGGGGIGLTAGGSGGVGYTASGSTASSIGIITEHNNSNNVQKPIIGYIENREGGLSVRTKLNKVIDVANDIIKATSSRYPQGLQSVTDSGDDLQSITDNGSTTNNRITVSKDGGSVTLDTKSTYINNGQTFTYGYVGTILLSGSAYGQNVYIGDPSKSLIVGADYGDNEYKLPSKSGTIALLDDSSPSPTYETGITISLSNAVGSVDTSPIPYTDDIFEITSITNTLHGMGIRYISTQGKTTFPIVENAVYISKSKFLPNKWYYLIVINKLNRVEYWFESTVKIEYISLITTTSYNNFYFGPGELSPISGNLLWFVNGPNDIGVDQNNILSTFNPKQNPHFDFSSNINNEDISIIITNVTNIESIDLISEAEVHSLDISNITSLVSIEIQTSGITYIDVSNNLNLEYVNVAPSEIDGQGYDQILIDLNNNLFSGSVRVGTSRTSASDTAKSDIISRGGVVNEI